MTRSFNRLILVLAMFLLCVGGGLETAQAQDSGATPVLTDKSPAAELAYWNSIKNSDRPEDYKAYLENFPDGMFYDNALSQFEKAGGNKSDLSAGNSPDATTTDTPETGVKTPVTTTVTKSTAKKSETVKTKKRPVVIKKKKSSAATTAKKTKIKAKTKAKNAKKAKKAKKAKAASCSYGRNTDGSCIKKPAKKSKTVPAGGESRGGGWG